MRNKKCKFHECSLFVSHIRACVSSSKKALMICTPTLYFIACGYIVHTTYVCQPWFPKLQHMYDFHDLVVGARVQSLNK
jgi:hypothetical protein